MKFLLVLLIIAVLINSAFGSLSILALKHKCNEYCSVAVTQAKQVSENLIEQVANQEQVDQLKEHVENDFKNSFPEHYQKMIQIENYVQSCENACNSLIEQEIFNYFK